MVTPLTPPLCLSSVTNGRHELVPKDVREEAEKYAKVSRHTSSPVTDRQTDRVQDLRSVSLLLCKNMSDV